MVGELTAGGALVDMGVPASQSDKSQPDTRIAPHEPPQPGGVLGKALIGQGRSAGRHRHVLLKFCQQAAARRNPFLKGRTEGIASCVHAGEGAVDQWSLQRDWLRGSAAGSEVSDRLRTRQDAWRSGPQIERLSR